MPEVLTKTFIPQIHAVGLATSKEVGEAVEAAFLARVTGLGFSAAKPWGDSQRYDFIVDSGHKFWRVQIKSTQRFAQSGYRIKNMGSKVRYTTEEIDFVVAYLIPETAWYVVPIADVASKNNLLFYPNGVRNNGNERYRERWCQMACPRHGSPSRILLDRPCERSPEGNICPLP